MGTRGAYGFYKNGTNKITYNHFDSYPEGLGADVVKFIQSTPVAELHTIFDEIEMIEENSKPTPEQIEKYQHFADTSVSSGSLEEWYVLLRHAQGDLSAFQKGLRHMIDGGANFMKDSLFCEWAYVINLDENVLEVYEGFQKTPQNNRYGTEEPDKMGYYNVKLVKTYPLDNIPKDWIQEVCPVEEEEDDMTEDEYQQFTDALGGATITISNETTGKINPFDFSINPLELTKDSEDEKE